MIKQLLEKSWGVYVAAFLTTLSSVTLATGMVYFLFQGQDLWAAVALAPVVSAVITFPLSFYIWLQLSRNISLSLELQRLVDRDRLTDLATRDFFFARMRRDPRAYGISLMVDIDFFKAVNDTFGHIAGDAVISRVAAILHENTRADDVVCRFGGEEFVIFLSEQGTEDGFAIAERMRRAIEDEIVVFEGQSVCVTVSIGGSLKQRLQDVDLAIKEADQALYQAKSKGRNRTVFAMSKDTDHDKAVA